MPNTLSEIVANKQIDIANKKEQVSMQELQRTVTAGNGSFLESISKAGLNIIAEIKPKSPSNGIMRADIDIKEVTHIYNKYACAISVLTDEKFFGGSFELLSQVVQQSEIPILCKDFILDPYQCFLARLYGAQAVLLIVKILEQPQLQGLYEQINELAMTPVVEVQNHIELARALQLKPKPKVILINNRNLDDFTINLDTTSLLTQYIDKDVRTISASGLRSREDIEYLSPYCCAFLIGSQFMRSANLESEFHDLLALTKEYSHLVSGAGK